MAKVKRSRARKSALPFPRNVGDWEEYRHQAFGLVGKFGQTWYLAYYEPVSGAGARWELRVTPDMTEVVANFPGNYSANVAISEAGAFIREQFEEWLGS